MKSIIESINRRTGGSENPIKMEDVLDEIGLLETRVGELYEMVAQVIRSNNKMSDIDIVKLDE